MGLDSYLYGAIHKIDGESCASVIKLEEVAYWRKQNAIHYWFVKNVQGDVDNRAMYSLTDDHLLKLSSECYKVLANPTVENAMTVLPTFNGPFFGGTDLTGDFEFEYS